MTSCSACSLVCCRGGVRGYSCDKYRHGSPGASGGGDSELSVTMEAAEASLYYTDRAITPYSLQPGPGSHSGVRRYIKEIYKGESKGTPSLRRKG